MKNPALVKLSPGIQLGLLLLLSAVVYGGLLSAGFYSDDWTFLTLARHGDGPLGFFVHDHSLTYMYRPVALISWWGLVKSVGLDAAWHYGFALLIHCLNALLLGMLGLRWGLPRMAAMGLAALFLLHPTAGATVSWLADRFDLLMSLGVLLVLWSSQRMTDSGNGRWGWVIAAGLLLAVGSKETGLSAVALLFVALLDRSVGWGWRLRTYFALAVFVIAYIWLRAHVLGSLEGIANKAGDFSALWHGTALWFLQLPRVLLGLPVLAVYSIGLLLIVLPWGVSLWRCDWARLCLLSQLLGLLTLLALMQAPVTAVVLDQPEPFASLVNHRFYYLATAASLLLVAVSIHWLWLDFTPRNRWLGPATTVLVVALISGWGWYSHQAVQRWQERTANIERLAVADAAVRLAKNLPENEQDGCLVRLLGATQQHADLAGYSDLMVKAQLPAGHPALNCAFASERMPWKIMTQWQAYQAGLLGIPPGREYSFHSGSLAVHVKTAEDADEWQWKGYTYSDKRFQ